MVPAGVVEAPVTAAVSVTDWPRATGLGVAVSAVEESWALMVSTTWPELAAKAREIYETLKKEFMVAWDDRGNIGKRYYAQDEIGTPYCITVDFDTIEKDAGVTVRNRDTATQERVPIAKLPEFLREAVGGGYRV